MNDKAFMLGRWYGLREPIPQSLNGFDLAETHKDQGQVWATFIRPNLQEWLKRH